MNSADKILFTDLAQIVEQGKSQLTKQVNSALTLTYWHIGNKINEHILENRRAEYGKEIISSVSLQLVEKYGKSFELRNLRRMMQFADVFQDLSIVTPLVTQFSWTHFILLNSVKTAESRSYYTQKSIEETWSKRELQYQIERKAFERQEIASLQIADEFSEIKNTFKDPYFLDFLGLKDGYLENDIESAILKRIRDICIRTWQRFYVCRTTKTHYFRRKRFLFRLVVLS
jgi:hypothetical protein